jgi:hypothetical protein
MSHGSGRTPIRIRIRAQINAREREDNRFDCAGVRDAQMVAPARTAGNRCADSSSPGTVGLSTFADSNAFSDKEIGVRVPTATWPTRRTSSS